MQPLDSIVIDCNAKLKEAMQLIDSNGQGICFVICREKLCGVLSDGDIRRGLLNGIALDDLVESVMNRNYFSLSVNEDVKLIQSELKRFKCIPIVDPEGSIVDYATAAKFHHIPLVRPALKGNELEYVTDCITTGWISSQGKYVSQFEEEFATFVGAEFALAVSNGTSALHLALKALGVSEGDEVIVPNLTFAATANAVLYTGASPVFVDIEEESKGIDARQIETVLTDRTRAIIAVHLYGYPVDLSSIMQIAEENNLLLIEDCAEAIGTRYGSKHVGVFGDAAAFSFFGNKTISTGEGGMVCFKNRQIAEYGKTLRDHGMSRKRRYWHECIGYNYRMTNLQAAVGCAQLEQVDWFVERKREIADRYRKELSTHPKLSLPNDGAGAKNSYWLYTISIDGYGEAQRDRLLEHLAMNGVEARPVFYPLHRMPIYSKSIEPGRGFPVSDKFSRSSISLPSGYDISESEQSKVCEVLIEGMKLVNSQTIIDPQ